LSFASSALSSPLTPVHARGYNASSPCAQVSASVATQTAAVPTVPAQLAYDCITSVPFNQSAALALVDGVVPYFKWQSTIVWLKDPPEEYVEKIQPPVDIWGGLGKIRDKVVGGEYENEFEVCKPLQSLIKADGSSSDLSFISCYRAPTTDTLSTFPMSLVPCSIMHGRFHSSQCRQMARSSQSLTFMLMC
jgi:hypothetical protein